MKFHVKYKIPCGIWNFMWNMKFHGEYKIPFGIRNSMWNTKIQRGIQNSTWNAKFHVEYKIPCRIQNSMWIMKFHVVYKIPCGIQNSRRKQNSAGIWNFTRIRNSRIWNFNGIQNFSDKELLVIMLYRVPLDSLCISDPDTFKPNLIERYKVCRLSLSNIFLFTDST